MNKTGKVFASGGLHLRQHPDAISAVLFTMSDGAVVKIEGEEGNWYKVRTAWGERGYLYKKYVHVVAEGPVETDPLLPPFPWHRTWTETFVTATAIGVIAWLLIWVFS